MTFPFPLIKTLPSATVSLTDHAVDGTDLTVYTFSAKAIGTASSGRYIIVGVGGQAAASRTISSLTIGGNAAAEVVSAEGNDGVAWSRSSFYILLVPTGTTSDIVVTFSSAMVRASIGVWSATNLLSSTATGTVTSIVNPGSGSISCTAGGFILGYYNIFVAGAGATATWAGITERFDETIDGGLCCSTGASDTFAIQQSGLTVSSTPTAFNSGALVLAAFR